MTMIKKLADMDPPPDIKLFLKGAGMAFGGGALAVAAVYFADPGNYSGERIVAAWPMFLAGGVTALAAYLKKSPLPQWKWERGPLGATERRKRVETPVEAGVVAPPPLPPLPRPPLGRRKYPYDDIPK